jgi:hypothetical protein
MVAVRRGVASVGVASGLVLVVVACRQLVGIGDEPPTDLAPTEASVDAGPGTIVYAGGACEACLQEHCAMQAAACAADPQCDPLEQCQGDCDGGDVTCRAACVAAHRVAPDAQQIAFSVCLAGSCAQPCGLICGGLASVIGDTDAAVGCQTCVQNNACAAGQACAAEPACLGGGLCKEANPNWDRLEACNALYADGQDDAGGPLESIVFGACHDQCAAGTQWFCVGSPLPSLPIGTSSTFAITIVDSTGAPVPNAAVTVCEPSSADCSPVESTGTTDADGGVTLTTAPSGYSGPVGYLEVEAGSAFVPELFYWGFPLSEPSVGWPGIGIYPTELIEGAVQVLDAFDASVDISGHGAVELAAFDCARVVAANVVFTVDPVDPDGGTRVFYTTNMDTFSPTATQTDTSGGAVIVNVPPGPITLTATPAVLGPGHPSSKVAAFARAGWITSALMTVNQ